MLPETVYKPKEGIASRQLGQELMLYDQGHDKVHILNETGILIWEFLDGKNSVQNIKDIFIKKFPDMPREEIEKDITDIIEKLTAEELVIPL